MGLVFLIVLGAILGWLVAIILNAETREGLARNIGTGVVGALLSGLLVSPMAGRGSLLAETYSVGALMVSLVGSLLAIICVNLFPLRKLR